MNALAAEANPSKAPRARHAVRAHATAGPGLTAPQIQAIVVDLASRNGENSPTEIRAVRTTRGTANALILPGETVGDQSHDVYAIALNGHFTGYLASRPPGAPAPTGTVMTMAIDATTGQLLDWGIQNTRPDLSSAGALMNIG
jgi:hypothetical protein